MVQFECCKDLATGAYTQLPSLITAIASITGPPSPPGCISSGALFALQWGDSGWVSADNNPFQLGVSVTDCQEFAGEISLECRSSFKAGSESCGVSPGQGQSPCEPFFVGSFTALPVSENCCWEIATYTIDGTTTPPPFGEPIPVPPNCIPTPEVCCDTPGEGPNGPNGGGGNGPVRCNGTTCTPISHNYSPAPIRYSTGEMAINATDLSTNGYGIPWGHTRSFANRQTANQSVGNGFNWLVKEWPYLVKQFSLQDSGLQIDTVVVQGVVGDALWYDNVGNNVFAPRFNVKDTLIHHESENLYKLYKQDGSVIEFDDTTGMFRRQTDPAGNKIEVTAMAVNSYNFTEVERTYTVDGSTTTEQFLYNYDNSLGDYLLKDLTLRRKVDAGAWTNISKVVYTYYDYDSSHGGWEDLETVTTQQWVNGAWNDTGTSYYRYYLELPSGNSSSSSSSLSSSGGAIGSPARVRLLKYVVEPAAYSRMEDDSINPLIASDIQLALYANYYFEYDTQRRVTKEMVEGASRTYIFSYEESAFADGVNSWKTKTTETQPDGSQNIIFSNSDGQTMLSVLKSGTNEWYQFNKYNDTNQIILIASSSAITGYDETKADLLNEQAGNYQYMKDNGGLVHTFTYDPNSGFQTSDNIQKGENGSSIKLSETEYVSCSVLPSGSSSSSSSSSSSAQNPLAFFISKKTVYPSDTDQTKKIVTSYAYTWYEGTCQVKEKTTILPVISTSQNGSDVANTRKEYFDEYGYLTWTMDERGYINRNIYDIPTGTVTQQIQDVDTGEATDVPAGWVTPSGGGLNLISDFELDDRGRIIQELGPVHTIDLEGVATEIRTANWVVYKSDVDENQIWRAQGYATGTAPSYNYTLINPVSIAKADKNGNPLESIQATRAFTSGKLLPTDTFAQTSYVSWTTNQYTECCLLESMRAYHTIPASGSGSSGTNYDQTDYGYDSMKRRNRTVTPGGTITFNVFDVRRNITKTFVGTDDTGATNQDPTGGGAVGNNMVQVTGFEYDGGTAGGDNNLTKKTQYTTASDTRITSFTYDWRNRNTETDGEIDYFQKLYYDNVDRVTKTEQYDTSSSGNLIARSEIKFNDLGHIYQTIRYGINPSTGTVGNSLTDNTWYDPTGNIIKRLPANSDLFTKQAYDSLGRRTTTYHAYDLDETSYEDAGSVTDDTVIEQTEISSDNAGNIIQVVTRQRYHDAPASQKGALKNPSTTPKARVTYQASYPDAVRRVVAIANYGTNGGTVLTRSSTIPTRSDNVLVSNQAYDSVGRLYQTTDPAEKINQTEYDAQGREIKRTMNIKESSSSSSSGACPVSLDTNIIVSTTYNADGKVSSLVANNSLTGNQTTTYTYGTTLSDSEIATSILKRSETYPDSVDSSDVITFKYNRQNQITEIQNQGNTVHSFDFDKLGRQTQDRITTLGTGVDGTVRRIAVTYEIRGMQETVTSYDNATVGSGSVLNDVKFSYNDFGQLITDYQSHSGTVNSSTTPKVQYGFANGNDNTNRPTTLTYPDGRILTYNYGTTDDIDDALSRVAALVDDDMNSTHLVDYSYLGLRNFVEVDYTEPDVEYTLIGTAGGNDPDTGDIYRGLDRFGRVKDSYWYDYGSSTDVDRIKYGYDRVGNRTYRENVVGNALSKYFDELYSYDGINRLKDFNRGTLSSLKDVITNLQYAECWSLDETGNWSNFRQDDTGNGAWDLSQNRSHNKVNEITDITESAGSIWVTPVYSKTGNMTTMPQLTDPTASFIATYDAWNRLVKIVEGANTVAEYEYDGAKRRVIQKEYSGGILSKTRNFYYTNPSQWQMIEERIDSSTSPERQFVWGLRYQDDLVLRDRDTTGNGTLNERLYGLQDANWNVTSVINTSGVVQERFNYDAYGKPEFLDSSFNSRTSSSFDWETLYCSYRWEAGTELFHVRNRTYHSSLGRWIQRDPLGFEGGFNLYFYVRGNPLNLNDPSGLIEPTAIPVTGGGHCNPMTGLCTFPTDHLIPEECGNLIINCCGKTLTVPVSGGSSRARQILSIDPSAASPANGCVTFPTGIECTWNCNRIKGESTDSIGGKTVPILSHEACHACVLALGGYIAYVGTWGARPDKCVGNELPAKPTW